MMHKDFAANFCLVTLQAYFNGERYAQLDGFYYYFFFFFVNKIFWPIAGTES